MEINGKNLKAYYSGWGMIYIWDIEYGIEDKVQFSVGTNQKTRWSKIRYDKAETIGAYFMANGHRIPLNECIRHNA